MNSRLLSSILVVLGTVLSGGCTSHRQESVLVMRSFHNYDQAITNHLSDEAVKYIDSSTIEYYTALIPLIINADSQTIESLDFSQQILLLTIRHTTPYSKVAKMDGITFFKYAVDAGLFASENLKKFKPGVVVNSDSTATVTLINKESRLATPVLFNKERGIWKINLPSITSRFGNETWVAIKKKTGLDRKEYIDEMLLMINNKKPNNTIWHPMRAVTAPNE